MTDDDVVVISCSTALGLAFDMLFNFENLEGPLVGVCSTVGIKYLRGSAELLFACGSARSLVVEAGTRRQLDGGISSASSAITADFWSWDVWLAYTFRRRLALGVAMIWTLCAKGLRTGCFGSVFNQHGPRM